VLGQIWHVHQNLLAVGSRLNFGRPRKFWSWPTSNIRPANRRIFLVSFWHALAGSWLHRRGYDNSSGEIVALVHCLSVNRLLTIMYLINYVYPPIGKLFGAWYSIWFCQRSNKIHILYMFSSKICNGMCTRSDYLSPDFITKFSMVAI
jgi:hypothetical protein